MKYLLFLILILTSCGAVEDAAEKAGDNLNPNVQVSLGTYRGEDVLVAKCRVDSVCFETMLEYCPTGYDILPAPEKDSVYWTYRYVFKCL